MRRAMRYLSGVSTLELFEERCTGCGMCAVVCPHAVLAVDNGRARILEHDACMECGACMRNCPQEAVEVQAGVGCAQAVINTTLGRNAASCCTLDDLKDPMPDCGLPDAGSGCEAENQSRRSSGCC